MYTTQRKPLLKGKAPVLTANLAHPRRLYPFWELKPGDSFKFPSKKAVSVRGSLTNHNATRKGRGMKQITCRVIQLTETQHACICIGYNGNEDKKAMDFLTGRIK
tara:strand:+ start:121 stop:435 length:315 start_codon:yes stop_codon:yes gene_type:complete